ncbi:MAG: translation initiation factor IF-2, partial [Alphaproteobacteria bacterium]|nr:translation initiation factor IF-2 [Alphaproteobacteria bacterium]
MTATDEQDRKKMLSLSRPGKLELKKTVEAGQVRQSFPHGRSKTVTVEVKKKRTFAQGAGGRMTEVRDAPELDMELDADQAHAVRNLTAEEAQRRMKAVQEATHAEAEAKAKAETDAERAVHEAEQAAEAEEARRAEEAEAARRAEDAKRAEEAAAKAVEARKADVAPPPPAPAPAAPPPPPAAATPAPAP